MFFVIPSLYELAVFWVDMQYERLLRFYFEDWDELPPSFVTDFLRRVQ